MVLWRRQEPSVSTQTHFLVSSSPMSCTALLPFLRTKYLGGERSAGYFELDQLGFRRKLQALVQ